MAAEAGQWRRCNVCKKPIALGAIYWTCNVSTCNRKRTGLAFCSVTCWDVHLPGANHRESWAVERTAPRSLTAGEPEDKAGGRRRLVRGPSPPPAKADDDILIVTSRLKDYVRAKSGFHTSDRVLESLSEIVRRVCDTAIQNARAEGRMTILDRDIEV